jgi:ATP-binding cassette subfamily B protein
LSEYVPVRAQAGLAWRRIQDLLRDPDAVLDRPTAKPLTPLQSEIAFNGVTFLNDGETALANVTAVVKRGQHVAFVGAGGSGKGTMLRLLMRFLDPREGAVTIDGRDLNTVTQASLRARMGLVSPENFIFSATLLENIRLGLPDASEELLRDAVRVAGIAESSPELPQGLDTVVGENGRRISGELRQRMAIARALLRSPDVLLLDEIGSALEPAEEAAVLKTLRELPGERTTISVTHRLASVAHADSIYMFDEGQIVEQGSHSELLAMNGFYAELWWKQSGFHFSPDGTHVDVEAARLRQVPVFEAMDEASLAELAAGFATETWLAGRDIVCAGDAGGRLYIVARGMLEVWQDDECVEVLEDGDHFGDENRHAATYRTASVCTCISIDRVLMSRKPPLFASARVSP